MTYDFIIVGAGVSGLTCAGLLQAGGHSVLVLEKSRGVGGRLASRSFKSTRYDYGAAFFSAQGAAFEQKVLEAVGQDCLHKWAAAGGKHPRFVGAHKGISDFAKQLAAGLDIKRQQKVVGITQSGSLFNLVTEQKEAFVARQLIITSPLPQAIEQLGALVCAEESALLAQTAYLPTLTWLLDCESVVRLPENSGSFFPDSPIIDQIIDNSLKPYGNRVAGSALTVHCTHKFSAENFDLEENTLWKLISAELNALLSTNNSLTKPYLHRWRYAAVDGCFFDSPMVMADSTALANHGYYQLKELPEIYLCGDAFVSSKVEGAYESGRLLAENLLGK